MTTFKRRGQLDGSQSKPTKLSPIKSAKPINPTHATKSDDNAGEEEDAVVIVDGESGEDDDRVGYRRPPKAHRFQKGRSGNPRGREPGRRDVKTDVLSALGQRVAVTENGKRRTVSMQTVIIRRMVADAARGDAKARDQLLRLIGSIELASAVGASDDQPHDIEDAKILERFRARLVEEIKAEQKKS